MPPYAMQRDEDKSRVAAKSKPSVLETLKSTPANRYWWHALSIEQRQELLAIRSARQKGEITHSVPAICKALKDAGWNLGCGKTSIKQFFSETFIPRGFI